MKRLTLLSCSLLLAAATAAAATTAAYRIQLRDERQILAKDRPVRSGSVLLYHPYPRGGVTGVPVEMVATINASLAAGVTQVSTIQVLNPGDVMVLGPTGADRAPAAPGTPAYGTSNAATAPAASMNATPSGGVYDPRNPALGYTGGGAPRPTGLVPTTMIGTDGTPVQVFAPPGTTVTNAPTTTIGPDGTPILAQPGTPGAQQPPIGPNGTPILAPPGTPGAQPPQIGPNGTPILAPPGAPGSQPPAVDQNGYPIPPKGNSSSK